MKNLKKLSRNELKNINGGRVEDGSSGASYMCCNHSGCSACIGNAIPACVAGAWPVPC